MLEQEEAPSELAEDQVVYVMADGSMIFTDNGWQEVKLGRVFIEPLHQAKQPQPALLAASLYAAHLGHHQEFEAKMDRLVQGYAHVGKRLVCISDGALWLRNYWQTRFPQAELILDFWHVMEKLGDIARQGLPIESVRQTWLNQQEELLKQSALKEVQNNIKALAAPKQTIEKVLQYLENNAFRMDYKAYLQRGLRIGSGAMESAHRTVIQCRMKRSGQRWSDRGAQNLLNLRVAYKSGKARLIRQVITDKVP